MQSSLSTARCCVASPPKSTGAPSVSRCAPLASRVARSAGTSSFPSAVAGKEASSRVLRACVVSRSAVAQPITQTVTTVTEGVEEINQSNFYDVLAAAGAALVVVDFYTVWCGPCKVMMPKIVEMAAEHTDVKFYKFQCNSANKELGTKLGIKAAPTFHLYKNGEKVAEMTGAQVDKLKALVVQYK